jgi:hypothetical protein
MGKQKTYMGFEDIPVYNFYKISDTSDFRWFYKKFYKEMTLELSQEELVILIQRYKDIYDERIKYTNDTKSLEYYRKLNEVSDLETKYYRISSTYDILENIPLENHYFLEFITYYEEDGFIWKNKVVDEESRLEYLKWLKGKIRGFNTKLNATKINYKDILEKPKQEDGSGFDLMKEKILLEEVMERSINIYKCSLKEWCAIIMRAEEKAASIRKSTSKVKN